jgi:hypothetical protein
MIKTIPNFIRNVPDIIELINLHQEHFHPREGTDAHASFIPNLKSRFKTLKDNVMSKDLIDAIFADSDFSSDLKDFYDFIQIQKYDPGDFIVPHRDAYSIRKLHLITLTSSSCDGLMCETEDHGLEKVYDVAGQYIDFPYDSAHWVDPVKDIRYSLVIAE